MLYEQSYERSGPRFDVRTFWLPYGASDFNISCFLFRKSGQTRDNK